MDNQKKETTEYCSWTTILFWVCVFWSCLILIGFIVRMAFAAYIVRKSSNLVKNI
jgi:hypothetical protein